MTLSMVSTLVVDRGSVDCVENGFKSDASERTTESLE